MVEEAATGMLLGTYRVLSSRHVRAFYSQSEFKMRGLLNLPGSKLELGRACVHPEHRNGVTITLLWRGISEYLKASRADYLFGCSSIKCTDPERVNLVYRYLATRHASSEEARVLPRRKFRYPGLDRVPEFPALDEVEVARARELVPLPVARVSEGGRPRLRPARVGPGLSMRGFSDPVGREATGRGGGKEIRGMLRLVYRIPLLGILIAAYLLGGLAAGLLPGRIRRWKARAWWTHILSRAALPFSGFMGFTVRPPGRIPAGEC